MNMECTCVCFFPSDFVFIIASDKCKQMFRIYLLNYFLVYIKKMLKIVAFFLD